MFPVLLVTAVHKRSFNTQLVQPYMFILVPHVLDQTTMFTETITLDRQRSQVLLLKTVRSICVLVQWLSAWRYNYPSEEDQSLSVEIMIPNYRNIIHQASILDNSTIFPNIPQILEIIGLYSQSYIPSYAKTTHSTPKEHQLFQKTSQLLRMMVIHINSTVPKHSYIEV